MPTKTTKAETPYRIDGRRFYWSPLDDNDERGNLPEIEIPMRIKLGVIRSMAGDELDAATMFRILEKLIPDSAEALDEMDVNDFQAMFSTWQDEYTALTGATPGE